MMVRINKKVCFYLSLIGLVWCQNTFAENFELAELYLKSYSEFDVEALGFYLHEDAVFEDLTSEAFGEKAFIISGREKIIERFNTSFFQNEFRLKYTVRSKFESSKYHVFNSVVTARTTQENSVSYSCGDVITILKIEDGQVVSHVDYADYKNFSASSKDEQQSCVEF